MEKRGSVRVQKKKRGNGNMAQALEATPALKGLAALKLVKSVVSSKPDKEKEDKLNKFSSRIDSYKR